MNKKVKKVVVGFSVVVGLVAVASQLSGCGKSTTVAGTQGVTGSIGEAGPAGPQGNGAGVLTVSEANACAGNGGVEITTFVDPTNTGVYESGDIITSTSLVCNGSQGNTGSNGSNGTSSTTTLTTATTHQCPTGGYVLTVTNGSNAPISNAVCNGAVGNTGSTGSNGQNGTSCSVSSVSAAPAAPNGGSLITCGSSQNLVLNGSVGPTGSAGATGPAGSPGTLVTPVQFCPGSTSYSSEFTEVGFCISNKLYAVYSANDGFMSEIPPGAYVSNGINSTCNFTVGSNCSVSH